MHKVGRLAGMLGNLKPLSKRSPSAILNVEPTKTAKLQVNPKQEGLKINWRWNTGFDRKYLKTEAYQRNYRTFIHELWIACFVAKEFASGLKGKGQNSYHGMQVQGWHGHLKERIGP